MDIDQDGRWMTYEELADARGIDRHSARRLASRLKWQRQTDNQQIVRVYVPTARAEPDRRHRDTPADNPQDISRAISVLDAAIAALRARSEADLSTIAALREQIEAERQRADAQRDRVEALQAQLAQLETEGAASDVQAAELTAQLKQARAEAAELRQADAARRARGRWARLWTAWRGE